MKYIKNIWAYLVMVGLIYVLHQSFGSIPPLGRLFSPFEGFLQNAEKKDSHLSENINLPGITDSVSVVYDSLMVPHIFAQNDHDLYYTQGYVIAQDRLWQMEFYTLVASGRLTEIVGERALEYDRYNRKSGMARASEKIVEKLKSDPVSTEILNAYADGVNAWIKQLDYKNLPLEYKILGYSPEAWTPYKTVLMLMNMRNTLNGGSNDLRLSNIVAKYGIEVVDDLFPNYPDVESPIIPTGTAWNFTPLKVPATPATIMALADDSKALSFSVPEPNPAIGSNNWAVSGSKSATGLPILSNDPHLGLTLPSIWYQMQLSSPNVNVYGACLPGSPGVIIGFNKDIAWGVTNVGSDVMDFYKIKFKDASKKEYFHDGKWKPVQIFVEEFKTKNGLVFKDTVYATHHGPIIYNTDSSTNFNKNAPSGHAMRWVTHESDGSDLLTFHYLNRAKNYDDYRKALTYYTAPAQNFIFASNQNDISITPNGKLPLKWKQQGKFILDGTLAEHDWQGWIPAEQNPTVKNPPRGFVSSANQFSTDPTYPYYLGSRFAPAYRGLRINERLTAMNMATVDSLRSLQNDNYNVSARMILPELISVLKSDAKLSKDPAFDIVSKWNMQNNPNEVGATIFEEWLDALMLAIWEDDFSDKDKMLYPTEDRTFRMIKKEANSKWFDNVNTKDLVETKDQIIKISFKACLDSLTLRNGKLNPETWAWTTVKSTDISHLVPAFKSFSRMDIKNGGGASIVNATTNKTGPSWRMIVQLDKGWPKAYGLYPGGQSGNPGSKYYDNMVDKWAAGELNELVFLKSKSEKSAAIIKTVSYSPKK